MKISLLRHFRVDFTWDTRYDSKGFDKACVHYDLNSVINQRFNIEQLSTTDLVYVSSLVRTGQTATSIGLKNKIHTTDLLNEVPIRSFMDTSIKLPLFFWFVIGRVQWYLNIKRQPETRTETKKRILQLIKIIASTDRNILFIGHGFYFSQMGILLHDKKYRGPKKRHYKNGEMIQFTKPKTEV